MKLDKTAMRAHAPELAYACVLLALFGIALVFPRSGAFSPAQLPFVLTRGRLSLVGILCGWLPGLIALWKLASPFLRTSIDVARAETFAAALLSTLQSALAIGAAFAHAFVFAGRASYFAAQGALAWMWLGLSLAFNAYSLAGLIRLLGQRNAAYGEYEAFRAALGKGEMRGLAALKGRHGIQRRMTLVFTVFIFATIGVLAAVLLRDFSQTILAAVIDKGEGLAERAASVVKSSVGDRIAVEDYFTIEAKKNEGVAFPFTVLTYYRRDPKTGSLSALESTDPARVGRPSPLGKAELSGTDHLVDRAAGTIEFRAPVYLSKVYLGYVSVVYESDVIFEPYFRTQVKVWSIAALFIYIAFFLTYLIGRSIVFPILFLRMSVNGISQSLARMMKGEVRVSADALRYEDRVTTEDEIKELSLEIGDMTGVIRGVIPYISATTLKHADTAASISERRELAFLFTDIRGFTTLCEGRSPEEVVRLLNHFLQIQADAIHASGGDIDKYVGDEVMAMFEGPDKELKACRASLAIRRAMAEERERSRAESRTEISVGIGINAGPVVFGSVGAKDRMDFTSIGDTVNLAARLEGANKTYGTKSLVTESVAEKVAETLLCREIDLLTVKGKTKPARIYELLQEKSASSPKLERLKADFEEGLFAYRARAWDKAEKAFSALAKELGDEPSLVFLRRIELFRESPPEEGWDGVFEMRVK